MSYIHLTTYERGHIEALNKIGFSRRKIGKELGRHHSTIAREINRNGSSVYRADQSQKGYNLRRRRSKPKGKNTKEIVELIEKKLTATWSPEQIANTITLGLVSFKTIYNWLYQGKIGRAHV